MFEYIFLLIIAFIGYWLWSKRKGKVDFRVLPRRFIVVDLETTGLKADKHEIIEVGAIKVDLNGVRNANEVSATSFHALIKPSRKLPKKITEITGITQETLSSDGENLEDVMRDFLDFVEDLPLVAYNADFDIGFLKTALGRVMPGVSLSNSVSCALIMARRAWPGLSSYKLSDLARMMKLSGEGTHRALEDAKRALVVYMHAATRLKSST